MSDSMGKGGSDGNREAIEDVITRVEKVRAEYLARDPRATRYWIDEASGRLGVKVRTEVLLQCLHRVQRGTGKKAVAGWLQKRMATRPPRRGPTGPAGAGEGEGLDGRRSWTEDTYYSWLLHREIQPDAHDAERITEALAEVVGEILNRRRDAPVALADAALRTGHSVKAMVEAILATVRLEETRVASPRLTPWIGPSFQVEPDSVDDAELEKVAEEAEAFLASAGGISAVLVGGPPYCGKKTALRYFIRGLDKKRFRLADGTLLPVLAVALGDHTPEEFVDRVYAFYAAGHFATFLEGHRSASLSTRTKIEYLCRMAADTPACIVLADIGPIDEDEIIRDLFGDYIGDLILGLLRGHRQTRILLSTHRQPKDGLGREVERRCEHTRFLSIPEKIGSANLRSQAAFDGFSTELPTHLSASGLSWRLATIMLELAKSRLPAAARPRFRTLSGHLLGQDNPGAFVAHIFSLLTREERVLAGLIASSQDGLRLSVLRRMLAALAKIDPASWPTTLPTEAECEHHLHPLRLLVHSRNVAPDAALVFHGEPEEEALYSLEDGWRRHFLAEWWRVDTVRARLAKWLVAREAAQQSRMMRVLESDGRSPERFGRDVQALHALIASIDPAAVIGAPEAGSQADTPIEFAVLPPLDVEAPVPNARMAFRYAFLQLHRRDIEGREYQLLTVLDDARTRLTILLALFSPETPWLRLDERSLSPNFRSYGHVIAALDARERIDLLASIGLAALRMQRYELLSAAARLGESVLAETKGVSVSKRNLMRLLRAEADAGLLLGGNPDAVVPPRHGGHPGAIDWGPRRYDVQVRDVALRVESLINGPFAPGGEDDGDNDLLAARGKLFARLGEVLHVAGRLGSARRAFDAAAAIETQLLGMKPAGTSLSPVFGGRGARAYLRFLLHVAQVKRPCIEQSFVFSDGLALPRVCRIADDDPLLDKALRLSETNLRRANRGRAVDAIGLKIDGARLAAARHEFALALRLLDQASEMHFGSGSSLEVLLELMGVRTRYLLDTATWCHERSTSGTLGADEGIAKLAAYLGSRGEKNAEVLGALLLERAASSAKTYGRLVTYPRTVTHPYGNYARYLGALARALESRRPGSNTVELLGEALYMVEGAISHMRGATYCMHLREALRFRQGLRAALATYGASS